MIYSLCRLQLTPHVQWNLECRVRSYSSWILKSSIRDRWCQSDVYKVCTVETIASSKTRSSCLSRRIIGKARHCSTKDASHPSFNSKGVIKFMETAALFSALVKSLTEPGSVRKLRPRECDFRSFRLEITSCIL